MYGLLPRLLRQYDRSLQRYPLLVKSITSSAICGSGDVFSQIVIEKSDKLNFRRSFNFSILGGFLVGPTLHVWYGNLARWFPGQSAKATIKRTIADQFVFAPSFLAVFITCHSIIEGKYNLATQHLSDRWATTVVANWGLWIPAQIVNFRFTPVAYQVLVSNITALAWNTYLSWSAHSRTPAIVTQEVEFS